MQHVSVMPAESLEALQLRSGALAIDATAGLGGHTRLISAAVAPGGHVYSCDRDAESLAMARANCAEAASPITFLHTPFSRLRETLDAAGVGLTDALLADFGTSMMHFQTPERGFSLMHDGPLDMRLDRSADTVNAADLVNGLSEKELADLIYTTGERRSRPIARALVRARPVLTMQQFASVILAAVPRTGKLHPATLSALSLRIAVNDEYQEIEALISQLTTLVRPGGRVAFITFHSGEDLIAKTGTRRLAKEGKARLINKHVLTPSPEETRRNPASRSAKMRILEII
ncbi:MAG TPA: 16S rRNA (cytosine(1402)-N(4))-methyltransferase RsmH [Bryobacteraceae bacterium]|nr:16S rRNA (cytosine(1402)-N(4))-methyltransferase RsmH [Bryobacteraceae bacterium]